MPCSICSCARNIITDQEAEEVRAELTKEAATTSAGKLKLSTPITELEIYGDARVRYEVRTGETGPPNTVDSPGDNSQRNRSRYRLRLGMRGTLVDDWFFGMRLETSTNPRSTNVTFGGDIESARTVRQKRRRYQRRSGLLGLQGL